MLSLVKSPFALYASSTLWQGTSSEKDQEDIGELIREAQENIEGEEIQAFMYYSGKVVRQQLEELKEKEELT